MMNDQEWVSADPVDRFWQLVRLSVEEARESYDMRLYVTVEARNQMLSAYFRTGYEKGGFSFTLTHIAEITSPPIYPLEFEIYPLLREFAESRDVA